MFLVAMKNGLSILCHCLACSKDHLENKDWESNGLIFFIKKNVNNYRSLNYQNDCKPLEQIINKKGINKSCIV